MILTRKARPEAGDLLVAQSGYTYQCLVFSNSGNEYYYDSSHKEFDNCGRYKVGSKVLPATELELRQEFFTSYIANETQVAKDKRDAGRYLPLTVTINTVDQTFDMHFDAQVNITSTLQSFEAARGEAVAQGWPDDGTLPWTLFDNSVIPVTQADLQLVHDKAVARGYQLHSEYQVKKAELEALLPDESFVPQTPPPAVPFEGI